MKKNKPRVLLTSFGSPALRGTFGAKFRSLCDRNAPVWLYLSRADDQFKLFDRHEEKPLPRGKADAAMAALNRRFLEDEDERQRLTMLLGGKLVVGGQYPELMTGFHPNATMAQVEASFRKDGFEVVPFWVEPGIAARPPPVRGPRVNESPRSRIEALGEALKANPKVRVTKFEIRPAVASGKLAAIAKRLGLSGGILRLYAECDGAEIAWKAKAGKGEGRIAFLPSAEAFGDWKGTVWFEGNDEGSSTWRAFHPMDFFADEAAAGLMLDGSPNPPFAYAYLGETLEPLDVDFDGYLDLVLLTRGFSYWQEAVTDDIAGKVRTTALPEIRATLPKLFPGIDLRRLLTRDYETSSGSP